MILSHNFKEAGKYMSNQEFNYNEQVDQSINAMDEFTGQRIEEEEVDADVTPPKRNKQSRNWSLYQSIYGNGNRYFE